MDKYNKYRIKTNSINSTNLIIEQSGGKFECQPKNAFKDICVEKYGGKYKLKESCINDCENLYIRNQLDSEKIGFETGKFYLFIKDIIKNEKMDVFIKGGNVIGLKILCILYEKFKHNDEKFKKSFNEFLKLNLIKDWDFSAYTKKITPEYREQLDKIANKYNLVERAKRFILYQMKNGLIVDGKALFEISVLDSENYGSLEIPLTSMKVKVTEYNIKYIFMFAKSFLAYERRKEDFDFDIIKRMISAIHVIIHPHKNGFYNDPRNFDKGALNNNLIKFMKEYDKYDKNLSQFLATHMEDPIRILYRLPEKNIPKTQKIITFLEPIYPLNTFIEWLFEPSFVIAKMELFARDFGTKLNDIYKLNGIEGVDDFVKGIYWSRVEIEYNKLLTDYGKNMLNVMLQPLMQSMNEKEIQSLDSKNNFYHLLQFLLKNTNGGVIAK